MTLAELAGDTENARTHSEENLAAIRASLEAHGQVEPLVVQRGGWVIAGNGRLAAMRALGWTEAQVVLLDVSDQEARALSIRLNRTGELAGWNLDLLAGQLQALEAAGEPLQDLGWDDSQWEELLSGLVAPPLPPEPDPKRVGGLVADWGAPPFTVLDTRQGYWQERRRQWLDLGLRAEAGREHLGQTMTSEAEYMAGRGADSGGSAFDPALADVLLRWFSRPGDLVLDPFSGGPVRGVVAAVLHRRYVGVDVRQEQVDANQDHWQQLGLDVAPPDWRLGDARQLPALTADMVLTCPPYAYLERYSDQPDDLSTMGYDDFVQAMRTVGAQCAERLRDGGFAALVMGEIRDSRGALCGLIPDTIQAFVDGGLAFYNDAILLNSAGSAPVRAGRQFSAGRKLTRVHQYVLVFVKGSPRQDLGAGYAAGQG